MKRISIPFYHLSNNNKGRSESQYKRWLTENNFKNLLPIRSSLPINLHLSNLYCNVNFFQKFKNHHCILAYEKLKALGIPIILIYGDKDKPGKEYGHQVVTKMKAIGGVVQLELRPGDGPEISSLLDGKLNEQIVTYMANW